MGRNEALDTILDQFLSSRDKGQAKEDINGLIDIEIDLNRKEWEDR